MAVKLINRCLNQKSVADMSGFNNVFLQTYSYYASFHLTVARYRWFTRSDKLYRFTTAWSQCGLNAPAMQNSR
jgi:hypothetical protein